MMTKSVIHWEGLDAAERQAVLRRPAQADDAALRKAVADIVQQVRRDGDAAVTALAARIDQVEPGPLRVSAEEIELAERELSTDAIAAIDVAIANVRQFHEAQVRADIAVETMPGVHCERVSRAIESVGLYVPAGTAPLPSTAIMLAVPATIAGCPTRIICTPPRHGGRADAAVVVAAARAGVTDIFKIGGAQAVAAMAYGTESVPKVAKIFGPGNAWVTMAKSLVCADSDGAAIDLPAGPSEVLVIADASASADFVAADLLSQAEHGADSQVILLTTSVALAVAVQDRISCQLATLPRAAIARAALQHSRIIVVADVATAIDISNQYAPEHLIVQVASARQYLPEIRNAGSVFLGAWTPESVGDYCSGTNHVLPTYGFARNYSGLGVDQFLRQMTVQECSQDGLAAIANAVIELANLEGLDAHARAVQTRLGAAS